MSRASPRPDGWGVDGCRGGWFYFRLEGDGAESGVVQRLEEVVERAGPDAPILVDIPIGQLESGGPGRACDLEARRLLGRTRGSSVFPVPSRQATWAGSWEEALRANRAALGRGLSRQAWGIVPKIREADELLGRRPALVGRLRECHPEVAFAGLRGGPVPESKKSPEGFRARVGLLAGYLPLAGEWVEEALGAHPRSRVARDDVPDALVAALLARRSLECDTLPSVPPLDPRGIPMEIVRWSPPRPRRPPPGSPGRGSAPGRR